MNGKEETAFTLGEERAVTQLYDYERSARNTLVPAPDGATSNSAVPQECLAGGCALEVRSAVTSGRCYVACGTCPRSGPLAADAAAAVAGWNAKLT